MTVPLSRQVGRLRVLIVVDVATTIAAALFMLGIYLMVLPDPHLLALTGLVALSGVAMACGLAPLERGDVRGAVVWWAAANWAIALVTATVATFAWPIPMLAALLPAVLATATATGRELVLYVVTSLMVCTAAILLGVLQDVTGLSAVTPPGLQSTILVLFTPPLVAMVGLILLQNSLRLQAALDTSLRVTNELIEQTEELRRSRARVVAATDRERRRIERDLHDGAQQRLISIGMGLAAATSMCRTDPRSAIAELDALRRQLHVAHDEVRSLAQGVYPPVLSEHGLVEALRSAVDRYPLPLTLDLGAVGRYPRDIEAAVYFSCVEALQNAAKHAQPTRVRLAIGTDQQTVWFEVRDDGVGFDGAVPNRASGIVNMRDRLGASGGDLRVDSAPGHGTLVRGTVPVPDRVSGRGGPPPRGSA
ncbi:sensor histidine kinase [Nocardioides sp.]|uniref:sensor histidine kinase n=1 Tax=Nocardioides sp. TaxID=35761 RepID=UPI0027328487|nr:histidine kinase [Nocardioides sp.]MDP3892398.1 histidine kinase [Nocardioides sp.]